MPVTATSFGLRLFARHPVSTPYHPSDSWGWNAPFDHSSASDLSFKTEAQNEAIRKPIRKNLPPVLGGMDKAEALACVSRLFDAAEAGAVLWGDALLVRQNNRRILEQLLLASSSSTG